mmetsp:Transcript_70871/g.196894  ORF Transcript_70871/g.196894 Transcript_70871/m.196894 type:complete len:251 (-) Transcript_70871:1369-2121(-)
MVGWRLGGPPCGKARNAERAGRIQGSLVLPQEPPEGHFRHGEDGAALQHQALRPPCLHQRVQRLDTEVDGLHQRHRRQRRHAFEHQQGAVAAERHSETHQGGLAEKRFPDVQRARQGQGAVQDILRVVRTVLEIRRVRGSCEQRANQRLVAVPHVQVRTGPRVLGGIRRPDEAWSAPHPVYLREVIARRREVALHRRPQEGWLRDPLHVRPRRRVRDAVSEGVPRHRVDELHERRRQQAFGVRQVEGGCP